MNVPKPIVYQRESDGRWVGAIELSRRTGEKRKRKTVYGKTEKEVWEKLNPILFSIQTGEYVEPVKDTLIDFLKKYHKICAGYDMWDPRSIRPESSKWEQTTSELYKTYIDVHFEPYFKNVKLKDVRTITLDDFYNFKLTDKRIYEISMQGKKVKKTRPPMSNNSVIKLNKFLKSAFNYAVTNEMMKKNYADGVKLSSQIKYKPVVYDEEQFLRLLDFVKGKDEEIPIILGAGCGLRRGEICGLEWGDVNFISHTITINTSRVSFYSTLEKDPKNETSSRKFIAPGYVIETLLNYYNLKGNPDDSKKIITRWMPKSLSEHFNKLLDRYELDHIRLHDLRHFNAVIMLRNGITDKEAAERLGHSTVQTLRNVYQHVLYDMDDAAANKINRSIIPKKELTKEEIKKSLRVI